MCFVSVNSLYILYLFHYDTTNYYELNVINLIYFNLINLIYDVLFITIQLLLFQHMFVFY